MSDRPIISIARADARRPLVFSWGVSSFFGWGIYGLNLMLHLADHPAVMPFCAVQFGMLDVVLDPLRNWRLAALAEHSAPVWTALGAAEGAQVEIGATLLEGIGNGLVSRPARTASACPGGRRSASRSWTQRPWGRRRGGGRTGSP